MRKPASQGSKLASKGAYIDVSDRRMQVQLTPEAKIASDFYFIRAIFAFVGFIGVLGIYGKIPRNFFAPTTRLRADMYAPMRREARFSSASAHTSSKAWRMVRSSMSLT